MVEIICVIGFLVLGYLIHQLNEKFPDKDWIYCIVARTPSNIEIELLSCFDFTDLDLR